MDWEPKTAAAVGSVLVGVVVFAFVGFGVTHLLTRRAALGATSPTTPLIGAPAGITAAIASGLVAYYVIWRHYGGGPNTTTATEAETNANGGGSRQR